MVALFYITVVLHYVYTPDDAYRYLQSAKDIAAGTLSTSNGMVLPPASAPLWVLLISGGVKVGLDPFVVAKTFDILFASLSLVLLYTFCATLLEDRLYAFIAVVLVALDASVLHWSGSGLETSFALILVLLTVKYTYLGDYHIAGFVAGLLTLVVPEGVLLFLVVLMESIIRPVIPTKARQMFWATCGLYVAVLVSWFAFSFGMFGPAALASDLGSNSAHWSMVAVLKRVWDNLLMLASVQPVGILILLAGIPLIVRKQGLKVLSFFGLPLLFVLATLVDHAVLHSPSSSRYLVPLIPLVIIGALWILKLIEILYHWPVKRVALVLTAVAIVTVVENQIVYRAHVIPDMRESIQEIEDGIRPLALWLRSNAPEDATVLTPKAATLGYIAERQTIDTAPVVDASGNTTAPNDRYEQLLRHALQSAGDKPRFVIDQAAVEARLASDSLKPVESTVFDNSITGSQDSTYCTLYKVIQ